MDAMLQVAAETKIGEVERELANLQTERALLDDRLQTLEKQLTPILAQRADKGVEAVNTPEPVRVPLAQTIHDQALNIAAMNAQLASILSRIEL